MVLLPHLIWLIDNNYITITYAFHRTGFEDSNFLDHIFYPFNIFRKTNWNTYTIFFNAFLYYFKI